MYCVTQLSLTQILLNSRMQSRFCRAVGRTFSRARTSLFSSGGRGWSKDPRLVPMDANKRLCFFPTFRFPLMKFCCLTTQILHNCIRFWWTIVLTFRSLRNRQLNRTRFGRWNETRKWYVRHTLNNFTFVESKQYFSRYFCPRSSAFETPTSSVFPTWEEQS